MTRYGQGVRSSRTSPVSKSKRERMKSLDRRIQKLDAQIEHYFFWGRFHNNAGIATRQKLIARRQKLDAERKALRIAIKSSKTQPE